MFPFLFLADLLCEIPIAVFPLLEPRQVSSDGKYQATEGKLLVSWREGAPSWDQQEPCGWFSGLAFDRSSA